MTLWDMLDKTLYGQEVWIYENNAYGQNMPLFKGTVDEARGDVEIVWDYLMCNVIVYECYTGILVLRVKTENYNDRFEEHYFGSDKWTKDNKPWKSSYEIQKELEEYVSCLN